MEIVFLGTSGSMPSPHRNVSAIAVKRGGEIILMDCGEGTQRQFMLSKLSFMQVSRILISHFHGDHFLGLPGLVQSMSMNEREEELVVYGPRGIGELVDLTV
ncbi:MAG: MBL fold metallo-hydrolase, partial [Candidatus Thermoplasmatota archaeon]|nr:MBL fold metallo-hydrolase [Candidatus Thermoplasmatota archaeon]